MPDYFGPGRRLYIDKLIDWETYSQLRHGHLADPRGDLNGSVAQPLGLKHHPHLEAKR